MSNCKILCHEVNADTDIILGRRGGVMGNACYQATIRRWAPMYAATKGAGNKKQMVCQLYSYLTNERGLRFLVQVGVEGMSTVYTLVTEAYAPTQRIQRSLQEHNRRSTKTSKVESATDASKGSTADEMEAEESIGDEEGSAESDGGRGLVTGNEARAGTPLPLLLERKSSAFTVSDTSIIEGLLNDDLFRQMSGYQLLDGEAAAAQEDEKHSSNDAAEPVPPHPAGPWPEIHLHHKSSDAIDTVSQITECSTRPESPRCPSAAETVVQRNVGVGPREHRVTVTSVVGRQSALTYGLEENRSDRMTLGVRVELQALRARVAAQEGELHVLRERVKIMEEYMTRQQERQQSRQQNDDDDDHQSMEGWPTVG
jgi:hypothetical protein